VHEADELAKRLMVKPRGEEGDAASPKQRPLIPEIAGRIVEPSPQLRVVERHVGAVPGDTEEPEERRVVVEMLQRGDLQAGQRDMRRVEVDGDNLGRIGGQVVEDVAAARRDRHDPAGGIDRQRREIDRRVFPDLIVDETREPEGDETVEQGFPAVRILPMYRGIDRRQTHQLTLIRTHSLLGQKYR
jgi:hypothetical protein